MSLEYRWFSASCFPGNLLSGKCPFYCSIHQSELFFSLVYLFLHGLVNFLKHLLLLVVFEVVLKGDFYLWKYRMRYNMADIFVRV